MDQLTYLQEAQNTKSSMFVDPELWVDKATGEYIGSEAAIDMFHAAMGISTEAGEALDPFKKAVFYGKPIDLVNTDEEIGDLLWYIAIYLHARGKTFADSMRQNNRKLKERFPDKFQQKDAIIRNLSSERRVLESEG